MNTALITEIKSFVNSLLITLDDYYYHQYDHALSVMERSIYIWKREWVTENEIELLAIASLFHDTGFTVTYDDNESIGAKIARNFLKSAAYPENKIQIIENLILATSPSQEPKTLLEQIIKDADMDNLGRPDFYENSQRIKKEIELIKNIKLKDPQWHHGCLDMIENHVYYTQTQKQERASGLKENKNVLKSKIATKKS